MSPKTGKTAERQAGILFRLEAMTLELGLQAVRYAAWWYDNVRLYPACVLKMPIDIDIRDHEVLGPMFREAEQRGELTILRRLIEKRFGALPNWAAEKLAGLSTTDLEELCVHVLDATSVEELLR